SNSYRLTSIGKSVGHGSNFPVAAHDTTAFGTRSRLAGMSSPSHGSTAGAGSGDGAAMLGCGLEALPSSTGARLFISCNSAVQALITSCAATSISVVGMTPLICWFPQRRWIVARETRIPGCGTEHQRWDCRE